MGTTPNSPSRTTASPASSTPATAGSAAQVVTNTVTPALTRAQILTDIRASEARIMQYVQGLEQRMGVKLDTIKGAVAPNAPTPAAPVRATFGARVPKQITGPGVKPAAPVETDLAAGVAALASPATAAPSTPAKS